MAIASGPNPPLFVIAGPTASGKSALALQLAERTGGVIVNADSAQLYADLPILSAAPSPADHARADHRLYGTFDGAIACSAADWARMAAGEIRAIHAAGQVPILVGGTGLYIRTLIDGIAPVPAINPSVRLAVRSASVETNRQLLERLDPMTADALAPGDTTRIARALEVFQSTGRRLADWQADRSGGIAGEVSLRPLILLPPRPWLYARCDERFERMMAEGAEQEVARLLGRGLSDSLPAMRMIGVREIAAYLSGEVDREQAIAAGQQATRRYAKRQYTWFAHQPPADWPRFTDPLDGESARSALALLGAND